MDFDRHNLQPEDAGGMVDGGMDDTYIDHLNSALDWSEREIARLKAELNKMDVWHSQELKAALAESKKLRELAHDLRLCSRESNCLRCEHGRFCDLRLDERCKELGIEVG